MLLYEATTSSEVFSFVCFELLQTIHLRNGAIYGSSVSVRVPVIPLQFQSQYLTVVITAYLCLVTDSSTKLHTSAFLWTLKIYYFSQSWNAPYNCQGMQFCWIDREQAKVCSYNRSEIVQLKLNRYDRYTNTYRTAIYGPIPQVYRDDGMTWFSLWWCVRQVKRWNIFTISKHLSCWKSIISNTSFGTYPLFNWIIWPGSCK